ncbi:hypothetical protein BC831DRAFT_188512 [Entophlyctis helioformis]|nr:hypothetical protein BC831DRAFT_188512 [Entophlyctis helioformis]
MSSSRQSASGRGGSGRGGGGGQRADGRGHDRSTGIVSAARAVQVKAQDRRVVFKHVLGTPFVHDWPSPGMDVQMAVLQEFCECVASVTAVRQRAPHTRPPTKSSAKPADDEYKPMDVDGLAASSDQDAAELAPLTDLAVGINAVTAVLEGMIAQRSLAKTAPKVASSKVANTPASASAGAAADLASLRCILVCRGDMPVGHIYAHIPTMAFLASPSILVCALSAGAEATLAQALGSKQIYAVGIKTNTPRFNKLCQLLAPALKLIDIPWLRSAGTVAYLPTNIRTIQTSAPIKKKPGRQQQQQQQQQQLKKPSKQDQQLPKKASADRPAKRPNDDGPQQQEQGDQRQPQQTGQKPSPKKPKIQQ